MPEPIDYAKEWEKSTAIVDKFNRTLIDLRKLGFSFITGLIAAGSIYQLGPNIQSGIIQATFFLIAILYWLDLSYQNVLTGALLRAHLSEIFRLNYGTIYYVSGVYDRAKTDRLITVVYLGLLVAGFAIFISINYGKDPKPFWIGIGIFIGTVGLIVGVFLYARKKFKIYRKITSVYNYFSRLIYEYKDRYSIAEVEDIHVTITSIVDNLEYFISTLFYHEVALGMIEISIFQQIKRKTAVPESKSGDNSIIEDKRNTKTYEPGRKLVIMRTLREKKIIWKLGFKQADTPW